MILGFYECFPSGHTELESQATESDASHSSARGAVIMVEELTHVRKWLQEGGPMPGADGVMSKSLNSKRPEGAELMAITTRTYGARVTINAKQVNSGEKY